MPRLRIAWMMAAVALVALVFAVERGLATSPHSNLKDLAIAGMVPMAGLLSAVLLALWGGAPRPFLLGFLASGSAALGLYAALAIQHTDRLHGAIGWLIDPAAEVLREAGLVPSPPLIYGIAATIATGPQLVVAAIGGAGWRRRVGKPHRSPTPA